MNTCRKSALMVGLFYILATAAGMLGMGVFTEPTLDAPDYLVSVSAHQSQIVTGALFELIMAVAVAAIGIAVYPVLRKHHTTIAVGYMGARLVEGFVFIIDAICLLTLLTLSQTFVEAGAPIASYFQTAGELLLAVRDWAGHAVLDVVIFPLGALIFNYVLYQSKLIPRWLSGLGLVTAILYWVAGVLVMYTIITPLTTIHIALQAPLGLQEMVFAVWLIVKGFNASISVPSNTGTKGVQLAH